MSQQYHVANAPQQMRGVYVQSLNGQQMVYPTQFGQAGTAQPFLPYTQPLPMTAQHMAAQGQAPHQQALLMNMYNQQQGYQNALRTQQAAAVAAAQQQQQQQQQQLRSTPPQQPIHGGAQQQQLHYSTLQQMANPHAVAYANMAAYPQYYTAQQLGTSAGAGAMMLGGGGGTPPSLTPMPGGMQGGPQTISMVTPSPAAAPSHAHDPAAAASTASASKGSVQIEDEYGLKPLLRRSEQLPAFARTPALPQEGEAVEPDMGRTPSQLQHDKANFMCLMRGIDMSGLGLQLVQLEPLYPTVATLPMDEHHYYVLPEIKIPDCYKKPKPKTLTMKCFNHYKEETLFYIFYSMPRDVLHLAAARALYERQWQYDKNHRHWFRPASNEVVQAKLGTQPAVRETIEDHEGKGRAVRGHFEVFHPATWETTVTTPDFIVVMADVEEESVLRAAMDKAARHNAQQSKSGSATRATTSQNASPPPASMTVDK